MKNNPATNQITELANSIFNEFSAKIGSEQIIRVAGLRFLGQLISDKKIISILEIGSGIGTITKFLQELDTKQELEIYGYEINPWCLDQLGMNTNKFHVLDNLEKLKTFYKSIDLLIIDDFLDESTTEALLKNVKPRFVFIEGHRRIQRLYFSRSLRKFKIKFTFKNYRKTDDSYKLGCIFELNTKNSNLIFTFLFIYMSLFYSKIIEIRSKLHFRKVLSRWDLMK
jgi:predicted O-methyltransferase YrrM